MATTGAPLNITLPVSGDLGGAATYSIVATAIQAINDAFTTGGSLATAALAADVRPTCKVTHSADQSIANGAATGLAFDSEFQDTDAIHDTVTNNMRLTCKTAGTYRITGQVAFAVNGAGRRLLQIIDSGGAVRAAVEVGTTSLEEQAMVITTEMQLAVNDWVQLVAAQTSGGALGVKCHPAYSPVFIMTRVA